ncbi:MAG TPA: helix-turn-helix domain-containing protein [Solirubrobacteraceae bacterium]|jgi:AcrR family transcriptional regulator|nr:helix-turn-helix domain-containing protein [Solirubrobacteraceae bacterium]
MATTPLRRRTAQQPKGDARELALLVAARRLMERNDFERASVSELAAAAGVSRPTFYFYFESKDALLASVIDATQSQIADGLDVALRAPGPPVRRLSAAIAAAADAWWEHRTAMSAALALAARMPTLEARMTGAMDAINEQCAELLLTYGTVPEREDRTAAEALVATLALLNERAFSHALTTAQERADLIPVQQRLLDIWQRALGLPDD